MVGIARTLPTFAHFLALDMETQGTTSSTGEYHHYMRFTGFCPPSRAGSKRHMIMVDLDGLRGGSHMHSIRARIGLNFPSDLCYRDLSPIAYQACESTWVFRSSVPIELGGLEAALGSTTVPQHTNSGVCLTLHDLRSIFVIPLGLDTWSFPRFLHTGDELPLLWWLLCPFGTFSLP